MSQDNGDAAKVADILSRNKNKNFVDRILNYQKYPTLPLGNGQVGTHLMSWSEVDGRYIVYPTIQWDGKQLHNLGPDLGYRNALKTGEFIEFPTPEEADWFSRNYKAVWPKEMR